MAEKINFELVSPERLVASEEADMVVVPGSDGDFGVLPGHTPFLTTVRPGVVDIHNGGTIEKSIFVGGGFAEATPDRCTVLATSTEDLSEASVDEARSRLEDAEAAMAEADDDSRAEAEAAVAIAGALVQALGRRPA